MQNQETVRNLVEKCLNGDTASQKKLFEIYSGKMYAICLRYASEPNLAKDFLQEGFITVYSKLEQFKFEGSFEGWLKRIFVNTALEHFRKQKRIPENIGTDSIEELGFEAKVFDKLNAKDLLRIISELPVGYRTVFNLYAIEGYTHKEIAEKLEISENTSKSQLRKARIQLIEKITKVENNK